MSVSLYDISVASYLQVLNALSGILEKGKIYCGENDIDLEELVETRLFPDMLPFRFQIISVAHHSLGTIKAMQAGVFKPPSMTDLDYEGLQSLITDTCAELKAFMPETVNALEGKDITFELGDISLPFSAEKFVMSFSQPNVYFHAATAYDILRSKGVPLGKRDFMGQMRMKT